MKSLCIVLLILALTASAASGAWVTELIARGKVGAACSLAVDAKGEPSCVYLAKAGRVDNVMLARRTGGEWKFDVLAEGVDVTGATAVTIDENGWEYVAFPVDGADKLICVRETSDGWITETVAEGKSLGRDISFAQWPNGHRDLAYSYLSDLNVRLNYAHHDNNDWDTFFVVTSGSAGSDNALFFDAAKRPNIVYSDLANTTVMHAVFINDQDWDTVKIGDGKDCDAFVTPDGKIHASFVSADNAKLYYVRHEGNGWDKPQEIANVVGLPGYTRVVANDQGDIFIAYVDVGKKSGLHMMTLKGEVWQHEVVYDVKFKDPYYDMAIAKEKYPLLCFSNGTGRGFRLAWYDDSSEFPLDRAGDDETPARAASLTLRPVAPNPVTGAATFSFELAEGADVRLAVYDAAGRKVATVAEGHYAAGVHDVPFRAGLAPGVYVYRLEAGGEAAAKKFVVAR
jgi:hypothetical protein